MPCPRPIRLAIPYLLIATVLPFTCLQRLNAQENTRLTPLSPVVANHYLVAYRNTSIPGDAEERTVRVGARVVGRNNRLGVAVVETSAAADDAGNLRRLAEQPEVEFVVHDRLVYAHQAATGVVADRHPLARPLSPTKARIVAMQSADSFYTSPQGWAVRQVGGFGRGVAGGPAYGPWDVTMGKGVRIAILDSGVDASHPDIAPNLVLNLSEIDQNPVTGLPSPCDDGSPQDQQGHGTWTASLAAGAAGATTGSVIGVAPEASILNIKVIERVPDTSSPTAGIAQQCGSGQASGLMSWVLQGISDAIANHADVIGMSLGSMVDLSTGDGAGLKALFDRATYAAAQSGAVIVAAAGNDGFDLSNLRYIELPAQARGVLTVVASTNPACAENVQSGAVCQPGQVARSYYSNFGTNLNALAAPGGSLPAGGDNGVSGWVRGACSAGRPATADGLPTDAAHSFGCFNLGHARYVQAMGTSASAPLAAGVAALLRAAHPAWDAATIIALMRSSSVTQGQPGVQQVNAAAAMGLSY